MISGLSSSVFATDDESAFLYYYDLETIADSQEFEIEQQVDDSNHADNYEYSIPDEYQPVESDEQFADENYDTDDFDDYFIESVAVAEYSFDIDTGFMLNRVIVQLAESSEREDFVAYSVSENLGRAFTTDLPDLGVPYVGISLLNPSAGLDSSNFRQSSIGNDQNNVFLLELEETGVEAVENALAILNANPLVEIAVHDHLFEQFEIFEQSGSTIPNDPLFPQQYALRAINAPAAWDITRGSSNVVVGVMDSGLDGRHPDLIPNLWVNPRPNSSGPGITNDIHGFNFHAGFGGIPVDDSTNHGTHIAGVVGARGNTGFGMTGVSWDVSLAWLGVGVWDTRSISASAVISAINYANNNAIHILIASWGGPSDNQIIRETIRNFRGLLVAAAGNDWGRNNDNIPVFPASYNFSNVIAVAASDQNNNLAPFSNIGPRSVHIAAPGTSILSTVRNGGHGVMSGTSFAAPHVAGVAALMLSVNPNLTPAQLRTNILSTARTVTGLQNRVSTGGIVDALAAVEVSSPPIERFVMRLYHYTLGRPADSSGLAHWSNHLRNGTRTAGEVAFSFVFSPELAVRNVSNAEFVDILYRTFMNREGDVSGRNHWISRLYAGRSRGEVFASFVNSSEFTDLSRAAGTRIARFALPSDFNARQFVTRFYVHSLQRAPDTRGLNHWTNHLIQGTRTGTQLGRSFMFSAEMNARNLNSGQFIDILYATFLGRTADVNGREFWLGRMNQGMTREEIVDRFARSSEFSRIAMRYGIQR